ncbi:acyltransferase [Paenibacillus alvei TS-15]|jgi:peptidoglycan/LPS O-acetylase OafA/YrhL|uniref:Acyltransferase n=1 Tax=Paenibacillus alvei TS-15 TaxID=1117108 RepID=S9TQY5_PAEAL|nr:acyltransferase family protein [Paenibacillus alvei]EPY04686.1 acyltransferase [Paenibacillus alvei TS-15]
MHELRRNNRRYMPALDGLRAIAVLAVIAYHLNLDWAQGGFLGVGIFFVLSGYLVTDLLLATKQQRGAIDLYTFWVHRVRRLVPAILVMLLFSVAWLTIFDPARLAKLRGDIWSTFVYGNNWYLIFHNVSYFDSFGSPSPYLHLWSLAVEGQFYLVWPVLLIIGLKLAPRRGQLLLGIAAAAAASALAMAWLYEPGTDPSRVYYGTDTRVFALLIGAALAVVWPSRRLASNTDHKAGLSLDLIGALGLSAMLYMIVEVSEYDDFLYQGGFVLLSIVSALTIAALAHPASRLSKLLSWGPLVWIGKRSYGIYLWHYPVIILTNPEVNTSGFDGTRAMLQVTASVLLAALSWRYIEQPIQRGCLSQLWRKLREQPNCWHRLSWKHWSVSACSILLLTLFCVGMSGRSLVGAAQAQSEEPAASKQLVIKDNQGAASKARQTEYKPIGSHEVKDAAPKKPKRSDAASDPIKRPSTSGANTPLESSSTAKVGQLKDKQTQQPNQSSHADRASDKKQNWSITAIGDSVMLDVAPYLSKQLPGTVVDAKIGRQMSEAGDIIQGLKQNDKLGRYVIIALGTNGIFGEKQLNKLIESLSNVEQIIFVNTRMPEKWEGKINALLAKTAAANSNITLVDWYNASEDHDDYFEPDGTHLVPKGAKAYAALLADAVQSLSGVKNEQSARQQGSGHSSGKESVAPPSGKTPATKHS